ncbi:carboxyl-terminal processing protease [Pustulibacterium marinum]|uniref:Carboxyl-terminal processing protease n=1 Tax=Pustulibacterium marinum TaxID=1224947 RepID=A0A1I7EV68_9FLAO|nr:carboxy terminal-processing peptidase [Pustulibacterium marinum]SFU27799.1 carboxyl-terminal processing protease [Pustulibacterium marinum]
MKKNVYYLLFVLLISAASCSFTSKTFDAADGDKDKLLMELITYVLERGHYSPKDIDDTFSEEVYDNYVMSLDPQKRYFLQSDIKEFEEYRDQIDDEIKTQNLDFFNITHERLLQRMQEAKPIYKEILAEPFDFSADETINVDFEELPYAKNKKELKERWRKLLKFNTITGYASRMESKEIASNDFEKDANGDLIDKKTGEKISDEDKVKTILEDAQKTEVEIEKEAREATLKNFEDYYAILDDLQRKDWFSIYLNAIVEEFDPHTFYFAPEDKEKFDTRMSGKFEGIGARLQKKRDNISIVEIISGGPVWRAESLEVGDEILKVAQGDEAPVDVVGMRIDDAVKLIKGPKGTEVRLTVKRVDGSIDVVSIIRDEVVLEESYAKTALIQKDGRKFGIVNLPQFYVDFDDYKNGRNAASDMKKEIERLKSEGMEGLVIDLRDNGGGSLKTVVDMAGLFIKNGPVVQVKTANDRREVLEDTDSSVQWNGPLVILVNELSASASEILAAAMQDYKRAIIIGSKQTYGKGTVQNVYDLNQFLKNNTLGDVGALKVTTQKFYRINGESTQLEGVKSDVVVPDRYSYINVGEKDQQNPLPYDKIEAANYNTWDGYIDYDETIENSKKRMNNNPQLKLIDANAKWVKEQQDDNDFPLSYAAYEAEMDEDENFAKQFKDIGNYKSDLTFSALPYETELFKSDDDLEEKRTRWYESMTKDVYIEEAVNVLEDLQLNNVKKNKVAHNEREK